MQLGRLELQDWKGKPKEDRKVFNVEVSKEECDIMVRSRKCNNLEMVGDDSYFKVFYEPTLFHEYWSTLIFEGIHCFGIQHFEGIHRYSMSINE